MHRECRERFPRRLQRKPLVSDPGMHHGTCVTHVPWCMSRSQIHGGGENVPGMPGACATRNFTYLARGPCYRNTTDCFKHTQQACSSVCAATVFFLNNNIYSTHWGRVTHICVSELNITASDNGLSPGRRQAIIWTSAGISLIRTIGTHFSEIFSEINTISFKKMRLKWSSGIW